MKNININNKGEEPINPTWVTKNGEKSHRALKSGEKTDYEHHLGGLTKREYFAGLAMNGLLSQEHQPSFAHLAEASVMAADALLKQLSAKPSGDDDGSK
jgi:hypothetical protein